MNLPPGYWYNMALAAFGDGAVWINGRLRYDPVTDLFSVPAFGENDRSENPRFLLGARPDSFLFMEGDRQIRRTNARGENAVRVSPELPAALRPPGENTTPPTAFAATGDVVWYRASVRRNDASGQTDNVVIGYDTRAETWTPPVRSDDYDYAENARTVFAASSAGDAAVYVLTRGAATAAAVQQYDARARRWSMVAPLPPDARQGNTLRLVSVDDVAVYLYDGSVPGLRVYDRRANAWTTYRNETGPRANGNEHVAVRHKNAVYVSTHRGLRRFDIAARTWQSLPIVRQATLSPGQTIGTEDAIWALFRPESGKGTPLTVARFDKQTGAWQTWGQQQGLPDSDYTPDLRLISAGKTVWLLNAGRAFRLSRAINRWEEQTPAALDAATRRYVRAIIAPGRADGNGTVWLLSDEAVVHPADAAESPWNTGTDARPAPFLWRWDEASETLSAAPRPADLPISFDRDAGLRRQNTRLLLGEPGALFVGTARGRVYRWDIAARAWRRVAPVGLASFIPDHVRRASDGALWFVGQGTALRWHDGGASR